MNQFEIGDIVISASHYNDFALHTVARVTKTWGVLDDGKKLPRLGGDGCLEVWNYHNQHGRHITTFYKFPNEDVFKKIVASKSKILYEYLLKQYQSSLKEIEENWRGQSIELCMSPCQREAISKARNLLMFDPYLKYANQH